MSSHAADECYFQDSISYILAGLLALSIASNLLMKKNVVQNCKDLCSSKPTTLPVYEESREIVQPEENHPIVEQDVKMRDEED